MVGPEREREREREPSPEPGIDPWYENLIQELQANRYRAETKAVVIRGKEIPWHQNRNARVRYYLHPYKHDTALQTMLVFEHIIHRHSGMHRHQGGLAIFVLDGEGYTMVEGERFDWEAEDLLLLPIVPGGVAHQHFNRNPGRPARWLALIVNAFHEHLSTEIVQIENSPQWRPPAGAQVVEEKTQAWEPPPFTLPGRVAEPEGPAGATLLDALFRLRDEYRLQSHQGLRVLRGRELPWEHNRQGTMRWYLHPCKRDTAIRSLMVYVQEIPPGGRSGRQRCPGGLVHYILSGQGAVEVDGVRHRWEQGDCVALPIKPFGVEYQFVNLDPQRPARYLAAAPNLFEVLGVDLGSVFEQLEEAGS